jgi:hypothetical protein
MIFACFRAVAVLVLSDAPSSPHARLPAAGQPRAATHAAVDLDAEYPLQTLRPAQRHMGQRHNDNHDPQHGSRAADFATRLRHDGVIRELSDPEFEHLCDAMRLHSDRHTTGEPAILACWDADRLDLGRVGIEPDPAACVPCWRTDRGQ